jgi:uroporphyrinogen-III decarboxylase
MGIMQARERFNRIMRFDTGIRTLDWEFGYWAATIRKWYHEGLPKITGIPDDHPDDKTVTGEAIPSPELDSVKDIEVATYLGFDKGIMRVPVEHWIFPRFTREVVQETDTHTILIDEVGIKQEVLKQGGSMPRFLGWPVTNREDFEKLKERFNPEDPGRFPENWADVVKEFRERDYPIALGGRPVGFFGSLRDLMGFERTLLGYYDTPRLIKDMLTFLTDFWISLWEKVLSQLDDVDLALIWEDMSYKSGSLISLAMFKEFMLPCYKRITDFLKSHGVATIFVDTDGNCTALIPLFMEGGVTGMFPFEAQAGMDIVKVAKEFPTLQMMGGLDKTKIAQDRASIDQELEKLPFMLNRGGYIPYMDHLVPPEVPWDLFVYYRKRIHEIIEKISKKM